MIHEQVDDFDARSLHVVHQGVNPTGKIAVGDVSRDADDQPARRGQQALVDAIGKGVCGNETALRRNGHKGMDHARHRAE